MDFEEFGFDEGRSITIHRMGDTSKGKDLVVPNSWNLAHLLAQGAQKLGMGTATKVFNKDGTEITDIDLIGQNDILYFSNESSKSGHHESRGNGKGGGPVELIGNYYVGRFLGKGAFGEVRIAHHRISGEEFAVKFIRKDGIKDFQNAERMSAEIMALTVLKHPNVLHMYEVFDTADSTCYVMEYVPGGDLLNYIVQYGTLSEYDMFKYFQQIISAVEYCHGQNIIHRDLKLENILLDKDQKNIKIADFGLCGVLLPDPTDDQGGTRAYSAPELFKGKTGITPALDIWSIGVIVYALLFGKLPFNADNGPVLVDNIIAGKYSIPPGSISTSLQDLISKMLTVNVKKRASIIDIHCHSWIQQMRRRVLMEKADSNKQTSEYEEFHMDHTAHEAGDGNSSPTPDNSNTLGANGQSGTRTSTTVSGRGSMRSDTRSTLPEITNKGGRRVSKPSTGTMAVSPRPPAMPSPSSGSSAFRKKPVSSSDYGGPTYPIKPRIAPDNPSAPSSAPTEKYPKSARKRGADVPPLSFPHSSASGTNGSHLPEIASTSSSNLPSVGHGVAGGGGSAPPSGRLARVADDVHDTPGRKAADWKAGYKGYLQTYRRSNNTTAS